MKIRYGIGIAILLQFILGTVAVSFAQTTVGYTTQPGDTLRDIAETYCTDWSEIYSLNQQLIGNNPNLLYIGLPLTIVNRCGTGGAIIGDAQQAPSGVYDRGARLHAAGTIGDDNMYSVQWGDTVFSIALRFGVPIDLMWDSNEGVSNLGLKAGTRIIIPGLSTVNVPVTTETAQPSTPPQAPTTSEATGANTTTTVVDSGPINFARGTLNANNRYIAANGDTMISVAARFGIPIDLMWDSNEGASNTGLKAGEVLIIPGFTTDVPVPGQ